MPAWAWALVALATAVSAGVLLLSIPFDVRVRLARPSAEASSLRVAWLWGAIGRTFALGATGSATSKAERTRARRGATEPNKGRRSRRARMPSMGLALRVLGLGLRLLKSIEVRRLEVRVAFGSGQAEQTGLACAVAFPLAGMLKAFVRKADLRLEPDFAHERFEYEVDGWVRVRPLRVLWPVLVFALRPSNMSELSRMAGVRA